MPKQPLVGHKYRTERQEKKEQYHLGMMGHNINATENVSWNTLANHEIVGQSALENCGENERDIVSIEIIHKNVANCEV